MAQVLPVAVGDQLVGSAVVVGAKDNRIYLVTALHILGENAKIQIVLPPTGGNCAAVQSYPFDEVPTQIASVAATDPFGDLALLEIRVDDARGVKIPPIVRSSGKIAVGEEIVVLGYPFAPLGSILETWSPGTVTALARRLIWKNMGIDELVLSNTGHPGSSGSAVIGRKDGVLYGILRGSLAPPEVMKIGNIPIATDTSVTFATSAHLVNPLLAHAQEVES